MIPADVGVRIIRDLAEEFGVPEPEVVLDHPRCESPTILGCFIPDNVIGLNLRDGMVYETTPAHEFAHYLAWLQGMRDDESEEFARWFEGWWLENRGWKYGIAYQINVWPLVGSALLGGAVGILFSMIMDFFPKPGASKEENFERGRKTLGVVAATSLASVLSRVML